MFFFYRLAWQRAFYFRGSATRQEFWFFMLLHCLITLTLIWQEVELNGIGWLATLYEVVSIIPMIALLIRRLHDIGRSGWWGWVFFIPLAGPIMLVYLLTREGTGLYYSERMAL